MFYSRLVPKCANENLLMVLIVVCLGHCVQSEMMSSMQFYFEEICITQEYLDGNCMERIPSVRKMNTLGCAIVCMEDENCIGASTSTSADDTNSCFKHFTCSENTVCSSNGETETKHSYISKTCDNGGKWQPDVKSCKCANGWVSPTCQSHPTECLDLSRNGYTPGTYSVLLDVHGTGSTLVPADCFVSGGYHHIGVISSHGSSDFKKSWTKYRDGFEASGQFWLGLNDWHLLSLHGYRTMILKITVKDVGTMTRRYNGFLVADESQNFTFTFDSSVDTTDYRGQSLRDAGCDLGDCFDELQEVPFSSWDRDNDDVIEYNCVSVTGRGWWFAGSCDGQCNLLGWQPKEWKSMGLSDSEKLTVLGMEPCLTEFADSDFQIFIMIMK